MEANKWAEQLLWAPVTLDYKRELELSLKITWAVNIHLPVAIHHEARI